MFRKISLKRAGYIRINECISLLCQEWLFSMVILNINKYIFDYVNWTMAGQLIITIIVIFIIKRFSLIIPSLYLWAIPDKYIFAIYKWNVFTMVKCTS